MDNKDQDVELHIRESWVNIDVQKYPVFCCVCSSYFEKLLLHSGSRYGQGASLDCSCGAKVNLYDGDNIVEWITMCATKESEVATIKFNFKELFFLEKENFNLIKEALDYDIYKIRPNSKITLSELIWEIEAFADLKVVPGKASLPVPSSVEYWFGLLEMCKLKQKLTSLKYKVSNAALAELLTSPDRDKVLQKIEFSSDHPEVNRSSIFDGLPVKIAWIVLIGLIIRAIVNFFQHVY